MKTPFSTKSGNYTTMLGLLAFVIGVLLHLPLHAQPVVIGDAVPLLEMPGKTLMSAHWSPDGETIAFSADNYNGIWLANADGSNIRLLTADQGAGFGFSWSPDGSFILSRSVVTENRRRLHQINTYDVATGAYEILVEKTRGIQGLPVWSGDGMDVLYVKADRLETISSQSFKNMGRTATRPVVYSHLDKVFTYDQLTKTSKQLQDFDGRILFNFTHSPEGNYVSFQVQGLGLYVMNADGTGLKQLGKGEKAAWLPGEKWVVVSVSDDDGHIITGGELYAVDIHTGESVPLTANIHQTALKPAVSPDGKYVLFDNPDDGKIYRVELR